MQQVRMQQVNEQDAPTGFYAVHSPEANCKGCAFEHIAAFRCSVYPCNATHRKDGLNVVYKPNEFRKLREAKDVIRRLMDGCSIQDCFYETAQRGE